jgi:hypothetical protein
MRRWRVVVVVAVSAAVIAIEAGVAQASGYWNVYQGNLPNSAGVRAKTSPYGGGGTTAWDVRMNWTSGSHDMDYLLIDHGGTWHNLSVFGYGTEVTGLFDEVVAYSGDVASAGCHNPAGLSQVYVNCRNADNF